MKHKKGIILIELLVLCVCFAGCGKRQAENPYGEIVAGLGDEDAYAFLVTENNYPVMVASDMVYDDGEEKQAAISCEVYYYHAGEAQKIGSILSEGTAYPIVFSKDGIYVASMHSIEKYAVSDQDGLLHLKQGVYENFDTSGNVTYICKEETTETGVSEKEYQKLQDEYAKNQKIHFSYGADGCVNEVK